VILALSMGTESSPASHICPSPFLHLQGPLMAAARRFLSPPLSPSALAHKSRHEESPILHFQLPFHKPLTACVPPWQHSASTTVLVTCLLVFVRLLVLPLSLRSVYRGKPALRLVDRGSQTGIRKRPGIFESSARERGAPIEVRLRQLALPPDHFHSFQELHRAAPLL